jgi:hypothetical protein
MVLSFDMHGSAHVLLVSYIIDLIILLLNSGVHSYRLIILHELNILSHSLRCCVCALHWFYLHFLFLFLIFFFLTNGCRFIVVLQAEGRC